ncbi:MAG: zinc ribbon domain-containing protein [Caldilineaceae bacterium]|nr:zinc ribbon domain-containing protein [Caldilineaceae bacterium]
MPIYEFVCEACGTEFEQIQSFSDSSVPACVSCHSTQVVRRMGRPAIHFKGSGWYITDSKKSNDKKGSTKSAANGGESTTETKPASTTESKSDGATETATATKSNGTGESTPAPKSTPAPVASD